LQESDIFSSLKGLSIKHLPRKKDVESAVSGNYDLIWIYTGLLFPWSDALKQYKQVMTGPDNLLLHHQLVRKIYIDQGRQVPGKVSAASAKKYHDFALHRERRWASSDTLLHVVGEADKRTFDELGAASHAFFSPHPYYDFLPLVQPIDQAPGKLTILVAGNNRSVYTGNYFERVVYELKKNKDLSAEIRFVFIGKGFEYAVANLRHWGFEITWHQWVESYEEAIAACHIQFFPIILGTGTKGKVLCALATGLLCIGSHFAFENILFDANDDAIQLENDNAASVIEAFRKVLESKAEYAAKAQRAAEKIRSAHSPHVTAELFWKKVQSFWKINTP
jgi:glycosyltransferase involved in cell wall biosynthesis